MWIEFKTSILKNRFTWYWKFIFVYIASSLTIKFDWYNGSRKPNVWLWKQPFPFWHMEVRGHWLLKKIVYANSLSCSCIILVKCEVIHKLVIFLSLFLSTRYSSVPWSRCVNRGHFVIKSYYLWLQCNETSVDEI